MKLCANYLRCIAKKSTLDKGHGRIEFRQYEHYDVSGEYFDARWKKSNFQSLFKVQRQRLVLKNNKLSDETTYYLSNGKYQQNESYFEAIRNHWSVETNNHLRDVTLKEDKLKTKKGAVTKVLCGIRTLVINLLQKKNVKNRIAQLEFFQDNFEELLKWLRSIKFL
ncbi:MAG: ISAs1 family transposase [Chitinophagales bacterium]